MCGTANALYRSGPCCGGRWTDCAGRWPRLGPPCQSQSAVTPPGWEDPSPYAPGLGCSWTTGGQTKGMVWLLFIISTLTSRVGWVSTNRQQHPVWHSCRPAASHQGAAQHGHISSLWTTGKAPLEESTSPLWHQQRKGGQYMPSCSRTLSHSLTNCEAAEHCSSDLADAQHYTAGLWMDM